MAMNKFEQKAFRYEMLGCIAENIRQKESYYMVMKTDDDGNPVRNENGNYVYEDPVDEYEKERLAIIRKIREDFETWALK